MVVHATDRMPMDLEPAAILRVYLAVLVALTTLGAVHCYGRLEIDA